MDGEFLKGCVSVGVPRSCLITEFEANSKGQNKTNSLLLLLACFSVFLSCDSVVVAQSGAENESLEQRLLQPKLKLDAWLFQKRPTMNLAFDLNSRIVVREGKDEPGFVNWFGIDFVDQIDWNGLPLASVIMQAYAVQVVDLPKTPIIFDDPKDWELQWRFVYLDFDGFAHKGYSLKVGHFQVPFGLEWNSDTTGTLRQYTNAKNLGVKADWGVSVHGTRSGFDYELSLTRGSGNEYRDVGDNHVIAARVGSRFGDTLSWGLSYLDANLTGQDAPIGMTSFPAPQRERWGMDVALTHTKTQWLAEYSRGTNGSQGVRTSLVEFNIEEPTDRNLTYIQLTGSGVHSETDLNMTLQSNVGYKKYLGPNLSLEVQWTHDIELPGAAKPGETGVFQVRYRF